MSKRRSGLSCASLNEELYVLGGYDGLGRLAFCEKYNFTTKKWTNLGAMDCPRSNFTSCIFESKIVAIGGYAGRTGTTSRVEVYDEAKNTWTKCKGMTVRRSAIAGVVVSGKDLGKEVLNSFQHPYRDQPDDSSVCGSCGLPAASDDEMDETGVEFSDMTSSESDESTEESFDEMDEDGQALIDFM